jgi:hypothetical protein
MMCRVAVKMALALCGSVAAPGVLAAEVALTKGSAGQACMSADLGIVPGHVTMDNGQESTLLGQSGKVLVRRIKSPKAEAVEIRSKFGIYPLEFSTSKGDTVWTWETDLPALDAIEASGETFLAQGTSTAPGQEPVSVAMEITVGDRETVEFMGCIYEVMQVTVLHSRGGKPTHEALVSYHPDLWMSFRTETRPVDGGEVTVIMPTEIATIR